MDKKINFGLLIGSLASFLTVAITLTVMSFGVDPTLTSTKVIKLICGICFWLFLAVGIAAQIVLTKRIKKWEYKNFTAIRRLKMYPKIGVVSVFKNIYGKISDVAFVISVITLIISTILSGGVSIICYISLSIAFFSFCSHCICNGKNFCYIINRDRIEKTDKKTMEESQ